MSIHFVRMTAATASAAAGLLQEFLRDDEFYLDSSAGYGDGGPMAVARAVELFLMRPDLGFVWLATRGHEAVGICVICYAISTSTGGMVAKLDDVYIAAPARGQGVGSAMLRSLREELMAHDVKRIDTSVHMRNAEAARFYGRLGFKPLHEERLALVL